MELVNRQFNPPEQSFYLFGPRGTGKTTWFTQEHSEAMVVDLLQPDQFRTLKARPERFRDRVRGETPEVCVVDEIQKLPELLEIIHSLIEERTETKFILTGSSARKIRRGGVDLMAGRAVYRTLHPFMASELGVDFNLQNALEMGMLPIVWDAEEPEDTLNSYVGLYLEQEVKSEGLVRNLGDFSRFLEAVSFSHGQVLNVSNVARECEVNRKTVEGFMDVLEDLLLSYTLPVFRKRAKRETTKRPKFYLFDTGVYRSLRPSGPIDRPSEIAGPALEGLVGQHLRAWIAYRNRGEELYFWRTRGGSEVDFVVYGEDEIRAIEVKHADSVRKQDLRHLNTFVDEYPESTPCFLYRGTERLEIDGIPCIPVGSFLRKLSVPHFPGEPRTQ